MLILPPIRFLLPLPLPLPFPSPNDNCGVQKIGGVMTWAMFFTR